MKEILIDGTAFESFHIPTANTCVLLVKAKGGFLGCGYFDVNAANRVGDAFAIVSGVQSIEQMLSAPILRLSDRARAIGVAEGMSGREALLLLQGP